MEAIHKVPSTTVAPNLEDYDVARRGFDWTKARAMLDGLPDGAGLHLVHEAVVRHARGPRRDHVAIRWLPKQGAPVELTFADLDARTARFANALRELGVGQGDRVFALMGRIPELYVAALGTLRAGCVFCPLFSAFGPEPIKARLNLGKGKALVTTSQLYTRKVQPIRAEVPTLEHVLVVGDPAPAGTVALGPLVERQSDAFDIAPTDPETPALLHFTSGTTGTPKGALHVHGAVLMHHLTGRYVLDLHPEDVFWCTADPGWVTGTSYGIIAPLSNGVTMLVDEADFDLERWYEILEREEVTVWYTAPTAIRMLMKAGKSRRGSAICRSCVSWRASASR